MKQVHGGKVYDTDEMVTLADVDIYKNSTYIGTRMLCRTKGGAIAIVQMSNGQDVYLNSYICPVTKERAREAIEGWRLTDRQVVVLMAEGIITKA